MEEKTESLEKETDNELAAKKQDDVNSEVVASVDSDRNSSDLNLPARYPKFRDNVNKRKRPRRKSKKGKYPYSKSSWLQRGEQSTSKRALRVRQQMFAHGQPVAPYNTTQFLIEDHGDLQNIDAQLQVAQDHGSSISTNRPSRARDSSFSIDSDEDYFYSSPEDEEEFLTKEFSTAYEDLHVERLSSMSKSEIIHDYLQLEAKYEKSILELKRLKGETGEDSGHNEQENEGDREREREDRDTDASSKSDGELAEQLRISQLENKSLKVELEELRKENKTLRNLVEKNQSSSVDSESDSSSTSSLTSTDSSSDSELEDDDMMDSADECKPLDSNEMSVTSEINRDSKSLQELNGISENGCMSEEDSELQIPQGEK